MSYRPILTACALAALAAATPALAASSASSQVSNVQLLLIDLNPGDGITPSVSFSGGNSRGEVSTGFSQPGASGNETATFTGLFGAWEAGSASVSGLYGTASSSLLGTGAPQGSTLNASGSAMAPGGGFCLPGQFGSNTCFTPTANHSATVSPTGGFSGQFQLSPNTTMVLSFDASLQAQATGGGRTAQFDGFFITNSDTASASVSVSISGPGPSGGGFQSSSDSRSLFLSAGFDFFSGQFIPASDSLTSTMGVSFTNLSSGSLGGSFSLNVSTNGTAYSDALLVPEPGTWAMMLAGMAAVAGIARRRRH